jgi:uncharacterized protein (TIGR02757 family)
MKKDIRNFLEDKAVFYNQPAFIRNDPVCIPHSFTRKQDIEISGLFAAIFSWGNRTTIIRKSRELLQRFDNAPYEFICGHTETDLKKMQGFKHRTFNDTDLLYFISFLRWHYEKYDSLEDAFLKGMDEKDTNVKNGLNGFHHYFFSMEDVPRRTRKHIAAPDKNSSCKRLNMYLRWMVRSDDRGVDLGIWKRIHPSQLICPLDVHVARVAKRFQLLDKEQADWKAAEKLTEYLRKLDPDDPVKFDFALFGLGIVEKY